MHGNAVHVLESVLFLLQLYTVVKNVKEAHECQEHGETQEFADDVEYLLSGIQEGEPMSTRCLRYTDTEQRVCVHFTNQGYKL